MAKIIEFQQIGGPEQLRLIERSIVPPEPYEVLFSNVDEGVES